MMSDVTDIAVRRCKMDVVLRMYHPASIQPTQIRFNCEVDAAEAVQIYAKSRIGYDFYTLFRLDDASDIGERFICQFGGNGDME